MPFLPQIRTAVTQVGAVGPVMPDSGSTVAAVAAQHHAAGLEAVALKQLCQPLHLGHTLAWEVHELEVLGQGVEHLYHAAV